MVGIDLIEEIISSLERESGCQISFAFVSADGVLSHRGNEVVATASTYKLALLIHLAMCVHEGILSWDLPLCLTDALKSRGTGILRSLTSGLELTLRDVCHLMTVLSDNTATDMLVNRFGLEDVNSWLRSLGLERTTWSWDGIVPHPRTKQSRSDENLACENRKKRRFQSKL
jgi:beta-lactamase class A